MVPGTSTMQSLATFFDCGSMRVSTIRSPTERSSFTGRGGVLRQGFVPDAPGPVPQSPPFCETGVDHQELSAYLELALTERVSGFIDVPVRFINPEQNASEEGFGDLMTGAKFALIATPERHLTFQFKVYAPTGSAGKGLEPTTSVWSQVC